MGCACLLPGLIASAGQAKAETLIPAQDMGADVTSVPVHRPFNLNIPFKLTPYIGAHVVEHDASQPLYSPLNDPRRTDYQVEGGVAYEITEKLLGQLEYQWHEEVTSQLGLGAPQTKLELSRSGFSLDGFNLDLTYKLQ